VREHLPVYTAQCYSFPMILFGELFRQARKRSGKSMGEVARRLELSVTFLSDVERGTRPPLSPERVRAAAAYLESDDATVLQLLEAAAASTGSFSLPVPTSPQGRMAGAALMRSFEHLDDEAYDSIVRLLKEKER